MRLLDVIGLGCASLISVGFYFVRSSLLTFSGLCAAVVMAAAATAWSRTDTGAVALLVLGLALYGFGLLIVRVMLRRSVSLRLLAAYMSGEGVGFVGEEIGGRVEDGLRYRLISHRGEAYALTPFGEAVAWTVGILYRLTRMDR